VLSYDTTMLATGEEETDDLIGRAKGACVNTQTFELQFYYTEIQI
jgi:hypothetical protein